MLLHAVRYTGSGQKVLVCLALHCAVHATCNMQHANATWSMHVTTYNTNCAWPRAETMRVLSHHAETCRLVLGDLPHRIASHRIASHRIATQRTVHRMQH